MIAPEHKQVLKEWIDQLTQSIYEELNGTAPASQPLTPPTNPGPHDEIGQFFIVYKPGEDSQLENMVIPTTTLAFSKGVQEGQIDPAQISALIAKESKATAMATKSLKEFQKAIVNQHKSSIAEWQKKRQYVEDRKASTLRYYGNNIDEMDDATQGNMRAIDQVLELIDKKLTIINGKLGKKSA